MDIQFTPEQIKKMTRLWGDNPSEWLTRIMVATSIVYEVPIEGEIIGRPRSHWLVWVDRNNPHNVHVEKRTNKWKDKKADYRIISMHYTAQDAYQALGIYVATLE